MSDAAMLLGARTRAAGALAACATADFGLGLEGGVSDATFIDAANANETETKTMLLGGWVALCARDGRCGVGSCARLPLPDIIADVSLNCAILILALY